jgi:hypothetical protein
MPIFDKALAAEIGRRYGHQVEMMQLKHGIFDEADISSDTVHEISRLAGKSGDVRRFRPNIVVRSTRAVPFEEDEWLGGVLTFGDADDAARRHGHDARRSLPDGELRSRRREPFPRNPKGSGSCQPE